MIRTLIALVFVAAMGTSETPPPDGKESPTRVEANLSGSGALVDAVDSYNKGTHVERAVSTAITDGQDAPVAGVYVHIPEPDAEPVVEEWFVRQQGGQCVVGSDDGSGSVIQECQTIPEGRPGPTEESPSPEPEESEDSEESEPEPV